MLLIYLVRTSNYLRDMPVRFPGPKRPKFKFIDLFAGIGGFRLACQSIGGECVFSSEWDDKAQQTYKHNFGDTPYGDITLEETKNAIPEHFDLLCAVVRQEAGTDYEGNMAVISCIMNRVDQGRGDVMTDIKAAGQFAAYFDGDFSWNSVYFSGMSF